MTSNTFQVVAVDQDGKYVGFPTTEELAIEITKLLEGRFNIKYTIQENDKGNKK